jgi:protein-S-isoprenylcysteine O-methyltransferase Ste14
MNYSQWVRRNRRNLGIPNVLASLILARFQIEFLWISLLFICAGEAIRIWAAGHLRKEEVMTTGGPYRIIRNPLYLGSFFIAIGFCLVAGSIWIWILMLAYFLLCYIPVIRFEENTMREKFPDQYERYAAIIPAFYPTILPYPQSSTSFSLQQVLRNKEYNAVLGIVLVYAILFLKAKFVIDL